MSIQIINTSKLKITPKLNYLDQLNQQNFCLFTEKFIHLLMKNGKKAKAAKIFSDVLLCLKKKIEKDLDINKYRNVNGNLNLVDFFGQSPKMVNELKQVNQVKQLNNSHEKNGTIFSKPIPNRNTVTESDLSVLYFVKQAVERVTPSVEVRKVRIAGTTYLVPAILSKKKQEKIAVGWLLESARKKKKNSNRPFSECLADEIFDAYKKQGAARQKRDELHRLAESNRAYIRYCWW